MTSMHNPTFLPGRVSPVLQRGAGLPPGQALTRGSAPPGVLFRTLDFALLRTWPTPWRLKRARTATCTAARTLLPSYVCLASFPLLSVVWPSS